MYGSVYYPLGAWMPVQGIESWIQQCKYGKYDGATEDGYYWDMPHTVGPKAL